MQDEEKPKRRQPDKRDSAPKETRLIVTEDTELMVFLLAKLPHKNRNNIKSILRDRQVWINDQAVTQYNHPLKANQEVVVRWTKLGPERKYPGLTIIYEDEHLILINKNEGILSMATNKGAERTAYSILYDHVKRDNPSNKIFIIHRLDRETSGLMMFAKSERVQQLVQETWGPTTKERIYLAAIEGKLDPPTGTHVSYLHESKALIVYSHKNPEHGQEAITHYETVKSNSSYSLLKVTLETGRKNQIRVHMQDLGHPIVGDRKYGASADPIGRLGLHAWSLSFIHPITGQRLRFETPIPRRFMALF